MYLVKHDIPDRMGEVLHRRYILEDVLRIAETLSINERVVITMRFRDGYKLSEIAAVCGCHEVTVGRRLQRICKKLCNVKEAEGQAVSAAIA